MRQLRLFGLLMLTLICSSMLAPGNAEAQAPAPSTEPSPCRTYTVRAGDWVDHIASQHGISVGDLLQANPAITAPDFLLTPGQVILLPERATGPAPCETYIVRPGDWIHRVASEHDISVGDLLQANPAITAPDFLITPGQVLLLPPVAPTGTQALTSELPPQTANAITERAASDRSVRDGAAPETPATERTPPGSVAANEPVPDNDSDPGARVVQVPPESGADTLRIAAMALVGGTLLGIIGSWAVAKRRRYVRLG